MLKHFLFLIGLVFGLAINSSFADETAEQKLKTKFLSVAVASDFLPAAKLLGNEFYNVSGIAVILKPGSSKELYDNVKKGANYDVYMSANEKYPLELANSGLTEGNPVLYALGTLALYAKGKEISHNGLDLLQPGGFTKLVIADPKNAPYGVAAVETLKKLEIYDQVKDQIVYADDALKAYQMVDSGQVEAGLISYGDLQEGQTSQAWIVPSRMHKPIRQAQVAIKGGKIEQAAKWIEFLESDTAKNILISSGFGVTNVEVVK